VQGEWQRFEALAARFARHFHRSPPAWLGEDALGHLPAELREGGEAYLELAGALDRRIASALDMLRERAGRHAILHIDATKIAGLDAEGCAALVQTLAFLAQHGNGVLLTGGEHLTRLLHAAASGGDSARPYWTLLLAVLRLRGQQAEFQRIALEYALATGEQPPEWEPVLMPVVTQHALEEKRDEPRYQTGPEALVLSDTLIGANDRQLEALQDFARDRQYVNVNLAQVARLDLSSASALVALANSLAATGKVVRLIRPNALVEALLEMLHLDARVQLVRPAAP
jgi:ABC-type transporter Mla MlaB component